MAPAYVAIEDGPIITGRCRNPGRARGELVFTTAYTGYEESLTDPSYCGQVLTFAYPLIGNYGVRAERFESETIQPAAALAREFTDAVSTWLGEAGVPAVDRLDTRDVVVDIRESGAKRCGIAAGPDSTPDDARRALERCRPLSLREELGARVSTDEVCERGPETGRPHVALVDCGVKQSIVDSLTARGAKVTVYPHDVTAPVIRDRDPDLLFISNGPGDPRHFEAAIDVVDTLAGDIPIGGICLGQQIIALALGGDTTKMEFGHRGVNQPVRDLETDRVVMTAQNHGFTVAAHPDLEVTQINVNDGTVEGLANRDLGIACRQYHPEAHPGPHDTLGFFDSVMDLPRTTDPVLAAD